MDPVTTPPAGTTPADTTTAVKPGYQTTEFWLSAAATLVGLLIGSGIIPTTGTWPQIVGLVTGILGSLGYTVSRGAVKAAAAQQ